MLYSKTYFIIIFFLLSGFYACEKKSNTAKVDVLVLGDGTGAISSALAASRSGSKTILVTRLPWLGGMLSSAGVPAIDGNHHMPSGIWGELRSELRKHYGGKEALASGWISHTLFEPHVADSIFKTFALSEENLQIIHEDNLLKISRENNLWKLTKSDSSSIYASQLIDGTDLGDIVKAVGQKYDTGLDTEPVEESQLPRKDLIQDFTFTAILKLYDTIQNFPKTINYNQYDFSCSCKAFCKEKLDNLHSCKMMLNYGKLPNNKYMINWPINGNDYYANPIEMSYTQRDSLYGLAKEKTLSFIYYINKELGYNNLGLADDEFPTNDLLPFYPYHREARRIKGKYRLEIEHLKNPYQSNYYKTGIAVGDYPIDHHHKEHAFQVDSAFVTVPSFNIPIAALLPDEIDKFYVADKSISVSHVVNGATRLQPVILQVGQAAGTIANYCREYKCSANDISVRKIQASLLDQGVYIMPTYDVSKQDKDFIILQKIAACGIIKLEGEPYKWANRSWFFPDTLVYWKDVKDGIVEYGNNGIISQGKIELSTFEAYFNTTIEPRVWKELGLEVSDKNKPFTRRTFSLLYNHYFDPFSKDIDIHGNFIDI
jgi:hypothetical protein